ncbi:unnamed protein product [Candida verbasci]|uniref:TATA-binding protein-associated factor mot1 n=1 Tax=Candida verbasci TaxID=1227364 RepID=A0A9W4X9Y7_9ASCO|nr:unnamed protein product [Candida verbasci]
MSSSSSRLDRLIVLLDGGTPFIRNTAADQLSDLAKAHPEDSLNLLGKVYSYLRSNKWETRISSARAIGGIVNHSPIYDPNEGDEETTMKQEAPAVKQEEIPEIKQEETEIKIKQEHEEPFIKDEEIDVDIKKEPEAEEYLKESLLKFDLIDLFELLKSSTKLVAKAEEIIDSETNESPAPIKQEQDLPTPPPLKKENSSARLRALEKRRLKKLKNQPQTIDIKNSLIKTDQMDIDQKPNYDITSQQGGEKLVLETKLPEIISQNDDSIWQFQNLYKVLLKGMFDPQWEQRHGSLLGLREIIRKHGKSAGRTSDKSRIENELINAATLEDLAVKLCILFCLDRFGDYVSDTVVAPVRESGAQTLAALLLHLNDETVVKTFDCLYNLVLQKDLKVKCWEAKHGGMLGVRYLVSVRTDILLKNQEMFDKVVNMVLHGLRESDDDVQSVAALTLLPIANEFVNTRNSVIQTLLSVIWDCLINLRDDLSASIGSVMDLLAKLCSHKQVIQVMQQNPELNSFEKLVPRLYPFLRHSITNVRKAVLRTLLEFLSIDDPSTKNWIDSKALRLIYQNLLVEQNNEVLQLSSQVYEKILNELDKSKINDVFIAQSKALLTLTMTPIGIARHNYKMNTTYIIRPSGQSMGSLDDEERKNKKRKQDDDLDIPIEDLKVNIDAPIYRGDVVLIGYDKFIAMKCAATKAFGRTLSYIEDEEILNGIFHQILNYINSAHATSKLLSSIIIEEYAMALKERNKTPRDSLIELLSTPLLNTLQDQNLPSFRELVPTLKSVRTSCLQLFDVFVNTAKLSQSKMPQLPVVVQGELEAGPGAFSIENAEKIVNETFIKLQKSLSTTYKLSANQALEDARHRIGIAIDESNLAKTSRSTSILASYSAAVLALSGVPKKLNPIIKSLMESIKSEETLILQKRSVYSIAKLIEQLNTLNKKGAADKIIKNLCAFLCVDTSEVPEFHHNVIYKDNILSLRKEEASTDAADIAAHERAVHEARIKRQGALMSLEELLGIYGPELFNQLPKLKEIMIEPLKDLSITEISDDLKGQAIIDALGILRALLPKLDKSLYPIIIDNLNLFLPGLKSEYSVFRYSTAKCLATICSVVPTKSFIFLVDSVLPMLKNAGNVKERQGAIETIYHISATMGSDILPYVMFLIVPVLGRMSDSDHDVRVLATTTFASIIKLVPLEAGIPDPEDMPKELLEGRDRERDFIQQMMDPSKIKPFDLPVSIKATLRKYQQEGVNWLAFLNKYHLHGILCDDMGLGKTLQTICIVSSDHHIRQENYESTKAIEYRRLPSLVICPPSLTGHWEQEINHYAPFMTVLVYAGNPSIRIPLRSQIDKVDVVVTSYDVCRNDVEYLSSQDYNYCVLDEGHIIKNSTSKLSKSVKKIRAEHRLILSGTPIQNNVLELWSLFDFLMPGFLGTEKVFHEKFAKPIAASRNSKTSSKEQEAGALALESLHKQVLPFMLRRLKEDVLSDLPPKIIQDYYCELSDLQKKLYKDFAKNEKDSIKENVTENKSHVFQALQYMRKLCNHPALILNSNHPKYNEIELLLKKKNSTIKSIEHAPKLLSLKTLLQECGIGSQDSEYTTKKSKKQVQTQLVTENVISEHRALIFCQLKDMLDMVENELLKKHLPSVTYMRLDGSTDPRDRQSIVRKFNEDPSIDVLLLTTKVGGLGLNLTGADTVIFVEHDWNPMNDLQAMDRAHRLGQKKVVNVYRLITKDTLEEKIMGLQKFKMNIASTIVNQQNAGLQSMDTNQLLDLFDVGDENGKLAESNEGDKENGFEGNGGANVPDELTGGLTGKAAGAVGELGELWDEAQYEDEYNLDNFIKSLK